MNANSQLTKGMQLLRAGRLEEALSAAQRAVTTTRSTASTAHAFLATVHIQLGSRAKAEEVVLDALAARTGTADAYDALAFVSMQLAQHERAAELYERATQLAPGEPRHWYNLASIYRSLGQLSEAEQASNQSINLDVNNFPAYLLRSELRNQTVHANHVDEMERLLSLHSADNRAVMFLGYALGKECDDLGLFEKAFGYYQRGAYARRQGLAYEVAVDEVKLQRIAETFRFGRSKDAQLSRDSKDYVFVIGLPRSGTTLLERILGGLPNVRSVGETDTVVQALMAGSDATKKDIFERFSTANPAAVLAHYRSAVNRDDGHIVIEKLPLNYLYLGAIAQALPGSTPILLKRHPIDSCFAMYRTLFGSAYPFTYDFNDLARYYAAYEKLTSYWREILGDWITEVRYEELVSNPQVEGPRIAAAMGASWREDALQIERNSKVSSTASASQVRRPIYKSSIGKWQRYRPYLTPLIQGLRNAGIHLPSDDG